MLFTLHQLPERQVILPGALILSPEWENFPPFNVIEADSWIAAKEALGFILTPLQRRILLEGPQVVGRALFSFLEPSHA